jgi:methylglyoxal reductase
MKYRKLGNSSLEVSVIGQGTWEMGGDTFGDIDIPLAIKAIQTSIDNGINFIDTAAAYGPDGASERVVGEAIKGRRDKVILATKVGVLRYTSHITGKWCYVKCLEPFVMRIEIEESLKRLGVDYIDLYQIHFPDYNFGIEKALEELVKMKEEGKIREIGVSNFSKEQILTAKDIANIASAQLPLNLLNRSAVDDGTIPTSTENNIGIITYGSLAGGILTGKMTEKPEVKGAEARGKLYPFYSEPLWSKSQELLKILKKIADERGRTVAEVSTNWVLGYPGVSTALIGAATPEETLENIKATEWELSSEEREIINSNYKRIFGDIDLSGGFGNA